MGYFAPPLLLGVTRPILSQLPGGEDFADMFLVPVIEALIVAYWVQFADYQLMNFFDYLPEPSHRPRRTLRQLYFQFFVPAHIIFFMMMSLIPRLTSGFLLHDILFSGQAAFIFAMMCFAFISVVTDPKPAAEHHAERLASEARRWGPAAEAKALQTFRSMKPTVYDQNRDGKGFYVAWKEFQHVVYRNPNRWSDSDAWVRFLDTRQTEGTYAHEIDWFGPPQERPRPGAGSDSGSGPSGA